MECEIGHVVDTLKIIVQEHRDPACRGAHFSASFAEDSVEQPSEHVALARSQSRGQRQNRRITLQY